MISRSISIKNFRNIGNDDFDVLELNAILDKEDKTGGLVTLIGMNNSGKSNYLDAMMYLKTKQLKETDKPLFNYSDDNSPIVSLWINDFTNSIKYSYTVKNNNAYADKFEKNKRITLNEAEKKSNIEKIPNLINAINLNGLTAINYSLEYNGKNINVRQLIRSFINSQKTLDITIELFQILSKPDVMNMYMQSGIINEISYNEIINNLNEVIQILKETETSEILNNEVLDNYGLKLIPNIITYDDSKKISDADLVIIYSDGKLIENNFQ